MYRGEGIPLKPVVAAAGAGQGSVQNLATFADPADLAGRNADHQGEILHVPCHHCPGGDQRRTAYRMAAYDGAVGSEGSSLAHERARVNTVYREMRPGCDHIREHAGRAAENIVFQFHAFVHGDVVLEPATVADPHIVADIDILTERTVPSDNSSPLDMAEVPYLRVGADGDSLIDIAAFVNEKLPHTDGGQKESSPSLFSEHSRGYAPRLYIGIHYCLRISRLSE